MWARIIGILLGVWLMAAPFVLAYGGVPGKLAWIAGPVAATFAAVAMSAATRAVRFGNVFVGVVLVVAAPIAGGPGIAMVNHALCGIAIAALAFVEGRQPHRLGGGWSALAG